MHPEYPSWLKGRRYNANSISSRVSNLKKVEKCYGDIGGHLASGTYQDVIDSLIYSKDDERANKPNPSKIKMSGNIRNILQSYKSAANLYKDFLIEKGLQDKGAEEQNPLTDPAEESRQRLSLERDMQAALRKNITSLEPGLRIIDDGAERAVRSGLIDITCEDEASLVVVELKAGKAEGGAIGQILGYMGDLQEEEGDRPVRGILVAHEFDKRTRSAARVVPGLTLKRYAIEFTFCDDSA